MTSSKIIPMIAVIALIIFLVFPVQSKPTNDDLTELPTRHKRWTFNTWRLHGRRQLYNDFDSPEILLSPSADHYQYEILNNEDNISRKIHDRLSKILREFNYE